MSLGGRVSPWRSAVEEGRSPLGRFRKPEPCFPRTYATWDAKKDENRFGSVKFRLRRGAQRIGKWGGQATAAARCALRLAISAFPSSVARLRRVDCFPNFSFSARPPAPAPAKP